MALTKKTCKPQSTYRSLAKDILKIIRTLNPNKAESHNIASMRMLKVCDKSTVKLPNSGHLRVLKNLSVTGRCPLLGGNLT